MRGKMLISAVAVCTKYCTELIPRRGIFEVLHADTAFVLAHFDNHGLNKTKQDIIAIKIAVQSAFRKQ